MTEISNANAIRRALAANVDATLASFDKTDSRMMHYVSLAGDVLWVLSLFYQLLDVYVDLSSEYECTLELPMQTFEQAMINLLPITQWQTNPACIDALSLNYDASIEKMYEAVHNIVWEEELDNNAVRLLKPLRLALIKVGFKLYYLRSTDTVPTSEWVQYNFAV